MYKTMYVDEFMILSFFFYFKEKSISCNSKLFHIPVIIL